MSEENKQEINKIKCAMCHVFKDPSEYGTRLVDGIEVRNKVCKSDLLKKRVRPPNPLPPGAPPRPVGRPRKSTSVFTLPVKTQKSIKADDPVNPQTTIQKDENPVDNVGDGSHRIDATAAGSGDDKIERLASDEKLVDEKGFLGAAFGKAKSAWCKMFPDKADQADAMLEKAKASKPVSAIINNEQVLIELANDTSAAVNSRLAELDNSDSNKSGMTSAPVTTMVGQPTPMATTMDIAAVGYKTIFSTATLAEKITERHPRKPLYGLGDAIKINESNIRANLQEFPEIEPLLKYNRLLLTAINMGVIGYDMMDIRLKKFDQNPAYFGVDRDGNPLNTKGTTMAMVGGAPVPSSAPKTELPRPSDTVAVQQLNGNIRPASGDQPVQETNGRGPTPKWGFDSFGKV